MKATARQISPVNPMLGWIVFLLIAVTGLFYVKWFPYYNRAFVAAANHSIGSSILMGTASDPPAPSWDAALNYALAYGKAIWQAMVLGLLLGSAVQALLPTQCIARLLGGTGFFIDTFSCPSQEGILWLHGFGNVFEVTLAPGEAIDIEPGGWVYKDRSVQMQTMFQRLSTGLFASNGQICWNRFTGPGKVALQSMYFHMEGGE